MNCKECGRTMSLDVIDHNFQGNEDKYFFCEHCMISCIERIRYGQTWCELWDSENDGPLDYIIKHKFGLGN